METNPEYNPAFRSDDEIYEDVVEHLERDPRVDEADVDIEVKNGVVKLSGSAESGEEAEMVESIVQIIDGVVDVVNELHVIPSSHTQNPWPGPDVKEESELEDIEVLPGDKEATEDYVESVEEGLAYIPPDEPSFPTTRNSPYELQRREAAEARSRERRKLRKRDTPKVEGQEL